MSKDTDKPTPEGDAPEQDRREDTTAGGSDFPTSPIPKDWTPPAPLQTPMRVGPYKVLQVLGEGGMGVVYLAEQQEPIRRRVALKVIKPGMDSRQVIARFEAERQALALMNHPNIAQVFEAGSTEEGRPYFVMEYVPGIPITTYCDENRLDATQRLELFVSVCDALQHAHQKGIIHRDIKPTNVLISVDGEAPTPKVIDFGVAKATSQKLTERTLFTEHGVLIGTPEYMSPEQAEINPLDVDTRSDIYSLGVLLYELLVGSLPFESEKLREAAWDEMQRTIKEVDAPTPSQRLRQLGEGAREIAARRRTSVSALVGRLRGDLDWVVSRALEKDRTRRYASAAELGADVTRHLEHERVLARPPSLTYKFRKLARKHKVAFAASTAVIVLSAIFLLVTQITTHLKARYARDHIHLIAMQGVGDMERMLRRSASVLLATARDPMTESVLRAETVAPSDRQQLSKRLDLLIFSHNIFDLILVVDGEGKVVGSNTVGPSFVAVGAPLGPDDGWQEEYIGERVDFGPMEGIWGTSLLQRFEDEGEWLLPIINSEVSARRIVSAGPSDPILLTYLWDNWWLQRDRDPAVLSERGYRTYLRLATPVRGDEAEVIGGVCLFLPWRHVERETLLAYTLNPALVDPGKSFRVIYDYKRHAVLAVRSYVSSLDPHVRMLREHTDVRVLRVRTESPLGVPNPYQYYVDDTLFGAAFVTSTLGWGLDLSLVVAAGASPSASWLRQALDDSAMTVLGVRLTWGELLGHVALAIMGISAVAAALWLYRRDWSQA